MLLALYCVGVIEPLEEEEEEEEEAVIEPLEEKEEEEDEEEKEWRLPRSGVKSRRPIDGTNAYWKFQQSNRVADGLGEEFGAETVLNLFFKGKGNKDTHGN
ncbi:hypothetical protein Tco_0076604 [Tanacetum coccineum]